MRETNNTGYKIALVLLVLILLVGGYYFNNYTNELKDSEEFLKEEKLDLQNKMDELIADLDDAIEENTDLSKSLTEEKENLIRLSDSIKSLKRINFSIIKKYKSRIAHLEVKNNKLLMQVDSLSGVNSRLAYEKQIALDSLLSSGKRNEDLTLQNKDLEAQIIKGSSLKVGYLSVNPMRRRSNGTFKSIERASRTDAFRISFKLLSNPLAQNAEKNVYIQIANEKNEIISKKGTIDVLYGDSFDYSDLTVVQYMKENMDVIAFLEVDRDIMEKGVYTFKIVIDGLLTEEGSVSLK